MRRIIATITLMFFVLSTAAFALPQQSPQDRQGNIPPHKRIIGQLNLTDQQVTQIREVVKLFKEDVKSIVKSDIPKAEKKTRIDAAKARAKASIEHILTPEQRAKAEELGLYKKLLNRMHHRHNILKIILAKLDLTDTQKEQIREIKKDAIEQAKAVKNDTTLDPPQKRAKLQEIRRATLEKIKSVLTPEQQAKLEELIKKHPKPRPNAPS